MNQTGDKKIVIRKLLAVHIPYRICNLRCEYCYLTQRNNWQKYQDVTFPSVELIRKAFAPERWGGTCLVNLTGDGETLVSDKLIPILYELLSLGHFVELVTNATLTNRVDEIVTFPRDYLERLEFKCSFHYMELMKRGLLDVFFNNVKKMREAGCSIAIELMPYDDLVPHIEDIKKICLERADVLPHVTVGRHNKGNKELLSNYSINEFGNLWRSFNSEMFNLKMDVYGIKRKEFCYAGLWTLYIDLISGDAKQCYGLPSIMNIYKKPHKKVYMRAVGHKCVQPYCFNAHAYLALGCIPELQTPTYREIRDRTTRSGGHMFSDSCSIAFDQKLYDNNKENKMDRFLYTLTEPIYYFRIAMYNFVKLLKKVRHKAKRLMIRGGYHSK